MTSSLHPAAIHSSPWFVTGPGESDILYAITTVMLVAVTVGLGVVFFRLHSLPERLGHKKIQFEIVAVLCLISLFTHIHLFWVAALLLALIDLPDFISPLRRMAGALEKISDREAAYAESSNENLSTSSGIDVKRSDERG
jgi:hypothetical protein